MESNEHKQYLASVHDVIAEEHSYVDGRRAAVNARCDDAAKLPPLIVRDGKNNLWGIAFSGGGIRSATFGLGVLQGLMKSSARFKKGIFRRVDYLSTVSGGGYIGSCLSSLLTHTSPEPPPPGELPGVDCDNSPFTGLNDFSPFAEEHEQPIVNSVRDQIHHLRSHGNYLAAESGITSFAMQRLTGVAGIGALYNTMVVILMFIAIVCLLHVFLYPIFPVSSNGNDMQYLLHTVAADSLLDGKPTMVFGEAGPFADSYDTAYSVIGYAYKSDVHIGAWSFDSIGCALQMYFHKGIATPVLSIVNRHTFSGRSLAAYCCVAVIGAVWVCLFLAFALYITHWPPPKKLLAFLGRGKLPAGTAMEDFINSRFMKLYVMLTFVVITGVTMCGAQWMFVSRPLALVIPIAFSLGGLLAGLFVASLVESNIPDGVSMRRSYVYAIKGGTLIGLVLSTVLPLLVIIAFSMSHVRVAEWVILLCVALGAIVFAGSKSNKLPIAIPSNFFGKNYKTILNFMLMFLLLAMIAPVSDVLFCLYAGIGCACPSLLCWAPLLCAGGFAALLFLSTFFIDINKLSPHYFYRDRLTESYLQTEARVARHTPCEAQGMPMKMVRNDERLNLQDLGNGNNNGPYHLITAALNLHGSNELVRKVSKSDHFLFSKNYCGSETTGYVPTPWYHSGKLRLARAMTLSGAAAGSSMGIFSFIAQEFFMTMLNLRLGQWMENPWWYCSYRGTAEDAINKKIPKHFRPERRFTFWLPYLLREMFGTSNAKHRLINLSDGGHTGDNLGLMTLLQRRCEVIIVSDAEADGDYNFQGLNNAIRLAKIEENIGIDINLEPLRAEINGDKPAVSKQSVVVGEIFYPPVPAKELGENLKYGAEDIPAARGILVYIKASVSNFNPTTDPKSWRSIIERVRNCNGDNFDTSKNFDTPICEQHNWDIPPHVENYNRKFVDFPHQSTGDQFFDMEQFEAYRAIGSHAARQAAVLLEECM